MSRMIQRLTVAMFLVLPVAIAMAAGQGAQSKPDQSADPLPDGKGKDVVVRICGECHDVKWAASIRLTRDGWSGVIDDMVQRGAQGTDDELAVVLDYLAAHFLGDAARPLNVNTAAQIDLETVAGLLRKEAAAVIEYREKNGPFKTLDDMKNVPGLDFTKIESRRQYLVAIKP